MIDLLPASCAEVVVLGAHCDDIALGAGATLLDLCRGRPGLRVHALVLGGAGGPREHEERSALAAFCPGAELDVEVLDIPDGRLPTHWERAKEALERLRRRSEPDLVLAPSAHDAHQDHRGLALLVPTAFRDHLVLGYEILKADPDLAQPPVLMEVAEATLWEKIRLLREHYPSQAGRQWFDDEAFVGLARIRGVQCHRRYAEGFHVTKLAVRLGAPDPGDAAAAADAATTDAAVSCRFCGATEGDLVLDLGRQPACDHFPAVDDTTVEALHPVRLWLCGRCGLAQLAEDPTVPDEPRAVEPQALLDQATEAVGLVAAAGLLPAGGRAVEFGSPHGGSWLGDLRAHGLVEQTDPSAPGDVVLDCFGLLHDADQATALRARVDRLAPEGTLFVQFHSLAAVLEHGQWNQFRHGHPVCFSTPTLVGMLREVGLTAVSAWWFPLYGGTVLLAARREGEQDPSLRKLIAEEEARGVTDPAVLRELQEASSETAEGLRAWVVADRAAGRRVLGYGAASRAVPLLNRSDIGPDLVEFVADAAEAKHGRRVPGTGIPIVDPATLVRTARTEPVDVLLFVPDLLDEVRRRLPEIEEHGGRWVLTEPAPRVADPAR